MKNNHQINFTFFGTDLFAVRVLATLNRNGLRPQYIITTPDTPQGRHLTLTPPPVKLWAEANKIAYFQPAKLSLLPANSLTPNSLTLSPPNSLFLVASYGKIIPESILNLPAGAGGSTHGTLNIHPSLLPKHRGSTPLQTAILEGDKETGVTIIKLDKEVDHGPIITEETFSLQDKPDITYPELRDELAEIGAKLFAKILPDWLAGKIVAQEQEHPKATFTKKITKLDGQINLSDDPILNYRKYRAYLPWPGVYFFDRNNKRLIIKKAKLENKQFMPLRVVSEGGKEKAYLLN